MHRNLQILCADGFETALAYWALRREVVNLGFRFRAFEENSN